MTCFMINMALDKDALEEDFSMIVTKRELQLIVAEEFLEHDLLAMMQWENYFRSVTVLQILLILYSIWLEYGEWQVGSFKLENYIHDVCPERFE